jgi:hypothetical protein
MRDDRCKEHRWSEDIVTLLKNWAMWMVASKGGDMSPFPAYNLAPPGKRAGSMIPMLNGDAEDADAVIAAMSMRYQQPLRMHYLWPNTSDVANAKRCSCKSVNTYKARLDEAHRLFAQGWYARRANIAQSHAYLHNKVDLQAGKHAA